MVAITATTYATPSAQQWQSRARLEQARREADQAESNAKQLRSQADDAEQQAQQSQTRVTTLNAQAQQSDSSYRVQASSRQVARSVQQGQAVLAPVATVARNGFDFPSNPLRTSNWDTLNRKASSGRLLNVSA